MDIRRSSLPSSARAGLPIGHRMPIDDHRDEARVAAWGGECFSRDETRACDAGLDGDAGFAVNVDAVNVDAVNVDALAASPTERPSPRRHSNAGMVRAREDAGRPSDFLAQFSGSRTA
jgi:hypothetical protein